MGQLNIKDEALIADAKALAELLGTSATGAVARTRPRRSAGFTDDRGNEGQRMCTVAPPVVARPRIYLLNETSRPG